MGEIKIEGNTKQATQSVNDLLKEVIQLRKEVADLKPIADASTKAIKEGTDKAKESSALLADKIREVGKSLAGTVLKSTSYAETAAAVSLLKDSFSAVNGAVTHFKDVIMEMEAKATMKTALAAMSAEGENLNDVLSRTLEITRGVASGGKIQATVNTLMTQGFNLSSEALEKLIDVSGIYSSVTGQDMNAVMNKLALGSQRERDATFEKMGVTIKVKEELERYSREIGKNINMMSESEKSNRLLIVATENLKEKFGEVGISANSLESPITTIFNTMEANIKKVKYTIVSYLSEIAGAYLQTQRETAGQSMVYFQQKYNDLLMVSNAEAKKLTEELLFQRNLNDKDLSKEDKDYYMGLYKQRTKDRDHMQVIATEKLDILKQAAEKEYFLEGEKSTAVATNQIELENITKANNERRDAIWLKHAKKMLTDEELYFLGAIQKTNEGYARASMVYLHQLQQKEGLTRLHYEEMARLQVADIMNRDQIQENFRQDEEGKAREAAENRMKQYEKDEKAKEAAEKLQKKIDEEHLKRNKKKYDELIKQQEESNKILVGLSNDLSDELVVNDDFFESDNLTKAMQMSNDKIAELDIKLKEDKVERLKNEKQALLDEEIKWDKKMYAYASESANFAYTNLIEGKTNFLKEMAAMAMKKAGAEMFNDGLAGMWQGGRWALSPYPTMAAQGIATMGYSALEMGAGLALGYAGSKLAPKTSKGADKDESAKDRNDMNKDNKQTTKVNSYIFPSERQYLQSLQASNNKLNLH